MSGLTFPVSAEDHSQGDVGARCTLLEYGDYQCPSCGQAYGIVKRLQQHFGKNLRFVFRNFPLSEQHAHAEHAAEAAEFAAANGKFWEMHDLLYQHQDDLGDEALLRLADRLRLPADHLFESLRAGTYRPRMQADFIGGVRSGVNGTPTFFIDGQRHNGPFDHDTLADALRRRMDAVR